MPWLETEPMKERVRFILELESGLYSMTELCGRFGISRKTGYKWAARYCWEGIEGLRDRSRAPKRCPQRTPEPLVEALVELRRKHPRWGPRKLLAYLKKRQPKKAWPAPSTVGDILRRHGLVIPRRRRRRIPTPRAALIEPQAPNEVWSVDFKGEFRLGTRELCYPLTLADGLTRYLLACRGLHSTVRAGVRPVMERAFRDYGIPRAILSDNGTPFATRALRGLSQLSVWWIKLGIEPLLTDLGHPEQNGRHERMHRTLKEETARPPKATWRAQQLAFTRFRREYNEERPHEALEDRTPAELYRPSSRPYPRRVPEVEYPGHYEVRRVHRSGEIKWQGQALFVSEALAGEPVGLEETDDGIWSLHFASLLLARFDERKRQLIG